MTRHFDDWNAPFPVRNLRYLWQELTDLNRRIALYERRLAQLTAQRDEIRRAIYELERDIAKRSGGFDEYPTTDR
jgi:cell division protein FtsB